MMEMSVMKELNLFSTGLNINDIDIFNDFSQTNGKRTYVLHVKLHMWIRF